MAVKLNLTDPTVLGVYDVVLTTNVTMDGQYDVVLEGKQKNRLTGLVSPSMLSIN